MSSVQSSKKPEGAGLKGKAPPDLQETHDAPQPESIYAVGNARTFSSSGDSQERNRSNGHTAFPAMAQLQQAIGNQAMLRRIQSGLDLGLVHGIHQLQPIMGNHGVSHRLQAKLTVNTPGDQYEQEADRVAEQVVHMPEPSRAAPAVSPALPSAQRKCACGGTCSKCQGEQPDHEHKPLQMKSAGPSASVGIPAPPVVHQVLRSPGQPLDPATRAFMEPRFGCDFSHVRVHTGTEAAASSRAVNALAYTVGANLVFDQGQYRPDTAEGKQLLAHELTHTMQQTSLGLSPASMIQRRERSQGGGKAADKPARKRAKKLTALIDQGLIDIETEDGKTERRNLTYAAPDAVPGTYLIRRTPLRRWIPTMSWNTFPGSENLNLFTWDGPPLDHREQEEFHVVAGTAGQTVHSLTQAILTLPPDIQFLLVRKGTLRPRTHEEDEIAYQIVKTIKERKITAAEIMDFQLQHPDDMPGQNYRERAEAFNKFFEVVQSQREARQTAQLTMETYELEFAGDETKYEQLRDQPGFKYGLGGYMIGRPERLAGILQDQVDSSTADYLRDIDAWTKLFEREAAELGNDVLLNLEIQLRQDMSGFSAEGKEPWQEMTTRLAAQATEANQAYDIASEYSRKAALGKLESAVRSVDPLTLVQPERRKKIEEKQQALDQAAQAQKEAADSIVLRALPKLRAAHLFKDFPFERILNAPNYYEVRYVVRWFFHVHLSAVERAREKLKDNPERIYKLDKLLAYAKKKHNPEITDGSFYDHVIQDRAKAVEADESLLSDLLMLLSIALSLIPGAGPVVAAARVVAGAADVAQAGMAVADYNEQKVAYESGQSSAEPSAFPVAMSFLPIGTRIHGASRLPGRLLPESLELGRGLQPLEQLGEEAAHLPPTAPEFVAQDVEKQTGKEAPAAEAQAQSTKAAESISQEVRPIANGYEAGGHEFKVVNGRVVRCSNLCGDVVDRLVEEYEDTIRAFPQLEDRLKKIEGALHKGNTKEAARLSAEFETDAQRLAGFEPPGATLARERFELGPEEPDLGTERPDIQEAEPARAGISKGSGGAKTDVSGQYSFREFERNGKVYKQAEGRLGMPGEVEKHRELGSQRGVSRGTGDDAGHLIGNRFGAPGGPENLGRQNWVANRFGNYYDLEDKWAALRKQGVEIDVRVTDVTRIGENRPFMRNVKWTEITPDGMVTVNEIDFANTTTVETRVKSGGAPATSGGPGGGTVIHVGFRKGSKE